jgi:hypothetical protein
MTFSQYLFKVFILVTLLVGNTTSGTLAHGGGVPQVTNAKAGPYRVSVWTQPEPLRAGEIHFTVAVSQPGSVDQEAGAPILNAVVELQLIPATGLDDAVRVFATHDEAVNKLFYEADVDLLTAGVWQVVVSVKGPSGLEQTEFTIDVLPASGFNWWIVFGGGVIVLSVAGLIMAKSSGQKGK